MRLKLSELATVHLGYQHREKIEPASVGTHRVIQVKDLVTEGRFSEFFESPVGIWTGSLYMVTPKGPVWKYQVEGGDVLFVAKGNRNYGVAVQRRWVHPYPESWENVVVGSHFYILRPSIKRVDPEYLAWYLNQPPTQRLLPSLATGSHMKMIPKAAFEDILVDVPSLATQHKIVDLHFLAQRERRLVSSISQKRSAIVREICLRAARGAILDPEESQP